MAGRSGMPKLGGRRDFAADLAVPCLQVAAAVVRGAGAARSQDANRLSVGNRPVQARSATRRRDGTGGDRPPVCQADILSTGRRQGVDRCRTSNATQQIPSGGLCLF